MEYNEPFKLEEGKTYDFPDFTLIYWGEQEAASIKNTKIHISDTFILFDIFCKTTKTSCLKKWSAGTGVLMPLRFGCGLKVYSLKPWEERVIVIEENVH